MMISDFNVAGFLKSMDEYAIKLSTGVMLCILSPVLLIGTSGLLNLIGGDAQESLLLLIGLVSLFALVAIGVMKIISSELEIKKYKFIKLGEFDLMENEIDKTRIQMQSFDELFGKKIALGVLLCILSPIPLIVTAVIGMNDQIVLMMVSVLLIIVSIAVNLFVRYSVRRSGYMQLLKVEDYDPLNKRIVQLEETIGGVYWPVIVAIFLGWSFIKSAWMISWVVFPVAGLIYAGIVNFIKKDRF